MENRQITLQLEALIKLEQQLTALLENEQYEQFQQQQDIFTAQIRDVLDSNSPETLATVINELKQLDASITLLQNKSEKYCQQLKQKSLLQKRNKNKLNAYK